MRRTIILLLLFFGCFVGTARGQTGTINLSVTSTPTPITVNMACNYVVVQENSASPTNAFVITLPGGATGISYPAGAKFIFTANAGGFIAGQTIGSISIASGSATFVGIESIAAPTIPSVKSGSGGGAANPGSPANAVQISNAAINAFVTACVSGNCLGVDNAVTPTVLNVPFSEAITGVLNIGSYNVVALPTPGTTTVNAVAIVLDGINGVDCSVGGGSTRGVCINTGVAWLPLGGATFANAAAQFSPTYYCGVGSTSLLCGVANGLTGQSYVATNAAAPQFLSPGVAGRTVSGSSDPILCDSTTSILDRVHLVVYTGTSATAVTVPQAGVGGCAFNFVFAQFNFNTNAAGIVTDTPTTSTINGLSSLALAPMTWCIPDSIDNTNYIARCARYTKAGTGMTETLNADGSVSLNSTTTGGTVTNPNGNFTIGEPLIAANSTAGAASSPQSIDCAVGYGVVGNGVAADNVALQACFSAAIAAKTTAYLPGGLNILLTAAAGGLPINFLNSGTQGALRVVCGGQTNYGQASTWFQTADAVLLFQIGKIANGSASQFGSTFENCGFRDVSVGANTALGAILVTDTNGAGCTRCTFSGFGRASIATPAAPSISGSGAGAVSFWVEIVCVTDAGGHTPAGAEATLASNSNPLTITAPTSAGCPAPSTGWLALATSTGTGVEVLQASSGCTLNASGTGCGLTNNWVGTVSNSGNLKAVAFKYDASAGFGIRTDSQSGANGTSQDASYGSWTDNYFQTGMSENMIFDGGYQNVRGGHCSQHNNYCLLVNSYQAGQVYLFGTAIEMANTTTQRGVILNSQSPSVFNGKFEGSAAVPNNITCAEVNTPRNYVGGNWTKCNTLILETANSGENTFDIHLQVSNGTPLISGASSRDIIWGDTTNSGTGSFIPQTTFSGFVNAPLFQTATNCSAPSSGGTSACGSSASGSFTVGATTTSTTINTTAMTANSQVHVDFDSSLGTKLGVTCNTTNVAVWVSGRVAATSFTVTVASAPSTNPACFSYTITN